MRQHVQPGRRRGVRGAAHLLLQRLLHGGAAAAGAEPGDGAAVPGGGPELRVLRHGQPPHDGRRPALLQGQDPPLQGRGPPAHHSPRRAPWRRGEGVVQGFQPVEGDARPPEVALRRRRGQCHGGRQEERQGRRRRRRDRHRRGRFQAADRLTACRSYEVTDRWGLKDVKLFHSSSSSRSLLRTVIIHPSSCGVLVNGGLASVDCFVGCLPDCLCASSS